MGATFGQIDALDLGEGTRAAAPRKAPKPGGIGRGIGEILQRAIERHQAQAKEEGAAGLGGGNRLTDLLEEGDDRAGAELGTAIGGGALAGEGQGFQG